MVATTWQSAPTILSVDGYRAWGQTMHDAFVALGLVQTTDTGQADWTTAVLGVSSSNTAWHYEVWRFDDPAQATAPIFVKVEWGRGQSSTGTVDVPAMWVTVGRATNGTGTLSNLLLARQIAMGTSSVAYGGLSPYPCFASGDASGFVMVLHPTVNYGNNYLFGYLHVERSRDPLGVGTADGVVVVSQCNSTKNTNVMGMAGVQGLSQSTQPAGLGFLPAVINGVTLAPGAMSNSTGLSKDASTVTLQALQLAAPGVLPWNSKITMNVHPGDATYTPLVAVTRYGEPHTYRLFPHVYSTALGPVLVTPGAYSCLPAILWDV